MENWRFQAHYWSSFRMWIVASTPTGLTSIVNLKYFLVRKLRPHFEQITDIEIAKIYILVYFSAHNNA